MKTSPENLKTHQQPARQRRAMTLTNNRLRLATIIAALMVAALAVGLKVDAPAVWTFLGLVITAILGQSGNEF